jgi:hypothetical protein
MDTNIAGLAGTDLIRVSGADGTTVATLLDVGNDGARRWLRKLGLKPRTLPDGKQYISLFALQDALRRHGEERSQRRVPVSR